MKIAIFGANSQIAKDFLWSLSQNQSGFELYLFSRCPDSLDSYIHKIGLVSDFVHSLSYQDFSTDLEFDWIINFVGIGDPKKTKDMGADIIFITEHYDNLAIDYLKSFPECGYIFLSSGAALGGNFSAPVDSDTQSCFPINQLDETAWYGIAKFYSEAKHKSLKSFHIVDVRVFSYFSRFTDIENRFLITDMLRCIKENEPFVTTKDNIYRDYMTPDLFYALILSVFENKGNYTVDCYTDQALDKLSLLSRFEEELNLKVTFAENRNTVNATGHKDHYYSKSQNAKWLGYVPDEKSIDLVMREATKALELIV